MAILQGNLFSLITSRIEGVVIDVETGEPIQGAEVVLAVARVFPDIFVFEDVQFFTSTGKEGKFKFDKIETEGEDFMLAVFKDGYASNGPIIQRGKCYSHDEFGSGGTLFNELKNAIKDGLLSYSAVNNKTFRLNQGEIKHFQIGLEKEAILKINCYRKTPKGKELLHNIGQVSIYHNKYYSYLLALQSPFQTKYLRDGFVGLKCDIPGYAPLTFSNIKIESGKVTLIEPILDYTTGQVLHGFVKYKSTGKPITRLRIVLIDNVNDVAVDIYSDENGEFWLGGFGPGIHLLKTDLHRLPNGIEEINFRNRFEFLPNEKKEILLEL